MALGSRLQGRQTQFYIELLYGVLFIAGFGFLVFRVDPRVAAFEGGLVVGYLLRIWEKMSIYERILEELSREAETQVATEVEEQVADEVRATVDDQIEETVGTELDDRLPEGVEDLAGLADLDARDDAPDVEELVVEGDVEELVATEVDAAIDDDERGDDATGAT